MESVYYYTRYTECDHEVKMGLSQIRLVQDVH